MSDSLPLEVVQHTTLFYFVINRIFFLDTDVDVVPLPIMEIKMA